MKWGNTYMTSNDIVLELHVTDFEMLRFDEFWQTPTGWFEVLSWFQRFFLGWGGWLAVVPQALWLPHPWWWLSSTCCCRVSGGPSRTGHFEFCWLWSLGPFEASGLQVLIAMAKFERSLSNNDLNKSMMQKIFLAQTLNIGTLDQFGNFGSGCLDEPGAALHVMYRS